jgi:hypothetical protein
MNMTVPAIVFLGLGLVFVVFSRQVTSVFRWLDRQFRDSELVGDPPRSVAILLGMSWIACAVVFWFLSRR